MFYRSKSRSPKPEGFRLQSKKVLNQEVNEN